MAINLNLIYVLVGAIGGWGVASLLNMARARSLLNEARKKSAQVEEEIKGKRREIELE